jgi:hypothetical protein
MYGTKKPMAKKKLAIKIRRNRMLDNNLKSPMLFTISIMMLTKRLYQGDLFKLVTDSLFLFFVLLKGLIRAPNTQHCNAIPPKAIFKSFKTHFSLLFANLIKFTNHCNFPAEVFI